MPVGLSAHHIAKIKYEFLELEGGIKDLMGRPPRSFFGVIFGKNGNGKSALYMYIAEQLQRHDRVEVWSYEQGHGPDMMQMLERHGVRENKWNLVVHDPYKKADPRKRAFEVFFEHVNRPRSCNFYIVDSIDACEFTKEDVIKLYARFKGRKSFLFLSFEGANKDALSAAARYVGGMGDYIIRVNKFVATVLKSRHGGWKDFVIWEEKARELNPLYFEMNSSPAPPKNKRGVKKAKS